MTTDEHVVHHVTCPVHEDQLAELEAANERLRADITAMGERLTTACLEMAEARRERDEVMALGSEGDAIHTITELRRETAAAHDDERRRIVRYLRGIGSGPAEILADQIEAGEHRR